MIVENSLNVLLIEDNIIEIMKMSRTVSLLEIKHKITEVKSADKALEVLEDKTNLPDIILLDLNMPKINGIEFLTILKSDEKLSHIPTIILTTSDNHKDIIECYKIGIAGYILKPLKYEDYVTKINKVLSYWAINELKK